ncbi:laminin subunit beta-4 [Rhinoderma darwinii]|uniref:laminin subunit beta-4 n=1 Tax=Rhinoderma darwinii TaxID=43563 RepID=UPI003F6633BE
MHPMFGTDLLTQGFVRLAIIEGTINSKVNQNILQENIRAAVNGLKLKRRWLMQQGNDPRHISKSTTELLKEKKICVLEWPKLLSLVSGQGNCEDGSCYPTLGDLLVGRSKQLSASSTCGQEEPRRYCIISYLEDDQKCFICDSRNPYNQYYNTNSHWIENVISTFDPDWKKKWWQSENGDDQVSIRLDLETLFQFSHLVMTFKTFRPAAMLVERSRDFGKTWKVFRYFAQNCDLAFPGIPEGYADEVGDVVCDSRYSDMEPSTEGEVVLKALDPSFDIDDPYDPYIQDIITVTNLRVNFTKLHTFGDTLGNGWQSVPQEKYYYAIYEMIVRGNCFCNGHASQCIPVETMRGDIFNEPGMVHGKCVCQHNTDGLNCEKCKEFYNDAPWSPAVGFEDNACRKCNCNGHTDRCNFNMLVYQANNGTSGGVCEDCQHNTKGNQCELCKPYFYHDPLKAISDPETCIPCDCDPNGTQGNGLCKGKTDRKLGIIAGTCVCKENVEGIRCDQCKPGYFGLNANDLAGCQYCGCNPFGTLPFSVCDAVTGACQCQSLSTGRHCDECLPGYWGLGNSLYSCSACNCDIGGSRMSVCSQSTGQCDCLPNIVGLRCNEPANGYYIAALDYYIYEAEKAQALSGSATIVSPTPMLKCKEYFLKQGIDFRYENDRIILKSMKRRSIRGRRQSQEIVPYGSEGVVELVLRQPSPGQPITWTGPGFARVLNGAGLRFTVNNIPFSMDFIIAIRYEPESLEDWTAKIIVNLPNGEISEYCRNRTPQSEGYTLSLPATSRLAILNESVCLDPNMEYQIDVYFSQTSHTNTNSKFYILVDSLGLIPQIASVSNLCTESELEEYDYYNCIEIASDIGTQVLPDVCERLIFSMSARIHNGALKCTCNPDGSSSSTCSKIGGKCQCKLNVVGSCCDRCAVGSYGFGLSGCQECGCDSKGSISTLCDQMTGQCACRRDIEGRRCDSCLPKYYGFPNCRPCQCNGNSKTCDPVTGACKACKGFTNGTNCERCLDNYYGNPLLGQPCRPCMCPGSPTSNQYFADSCQQDKETLEVTCNCLEGYTGKNCDECPDGFYGNIEEGEKCLPCQCNNNIDVNDPDACDKVTGECLKCMNNAYGPNCESCLPGYFGSGLHQNCSSCLCDPIGTNAQNCSIYEEVGECVCDRTTGQCPCLPNVVGISCDTCASGYWDFTSGKGCKSCDCYLNNSKGNECNELTGQCLCKPKYTGMKCDQCEENYYGNPALQCILCKCNLEGTQKPICDKETGSCNCKSGVTGRNCDQCAPKFKQEFPACPRCHMCFDQYDTEVSSLLNSVHALVRLAANIGPTRSPTGCDVQMSILQDKLSAIEKIFRSPILSPEKYNKVKKYYDSIRQKVDKIKVPDLRKFSEIAKMNKTISEMGTEIDYLFTELNKIKKKKEKENTIKDNDIQESFDKITIHYKTSLSAVDRARNATPIIKTATKTSKNILNALNNLDAKDKQNFDKLNRMKSLQISKMNEMVCGTVWDFPCDVAPCGGALCRDKFGKRKCGGPNCNGVLSLAKDGLNKANETDTKLKRVAIHLLDAGKQIENIRQLAEDTKLKASRLSKTLSKAMSRIEADKNRSKELIKNVKDFLLDSIPVHHCRRQSVLGGGIAKAPQEFDATASPEEIERIANEILAIKLPAAPYDLINMLNKIKKYCDDYKQNKKNLQKQLEEVKALTQRAKDAKKAVEKIPNGDEIRNNLKQAENAQKKTNTLLKNVNKDIQDVRNKLSQAQARAEKVDNKLKDIKDMHSQLESKIAELQEKMLKNRNAADKAQKGANNALKEASKSEQDLNNLKEKYELLKEKLKKQDIPQEILERLQNLKKNAENLVNAINEKFERISDLEEKIDDLNKANEEKVNELLQLEERALELKNYIVEEEAKQANCGD